MQSDISRQAALRLVFPCRWKGMVMIRGDEFKLSKGTLVRAPQRGVFGDLGTFLGTGWFSKGGEGAGSGVGAGVGVGAGGGDGRGGGSHGGLWHPVFLVLQGSRLVWWSSEYDIDDGKACIGQLLLYGHAGTTQVCVCVCAYIFIYQFI